jgi:hypothetical protein
MFPRIEHTSKVVQQQINSQFLVGFLPLMEFIGDNQQPLISHGFKLMKYKLHEYKNKYSLND